MKSFTRKILFFMACVLLAASALVQAEEKQQSKTELVVKTDMLISTEQLQEKLDDPNLRLIDVTSHLGFSIFKWGPAPKSGRSDFEELHISGAIFLDLVDELSDPESEFNYAKPSVEQIEAVLSNAGISHHHDIVLYSQSGVMWATRAWWVLRAAGLEKLAILDGGFSKWQEEERPVSDQLVQHEKTVFKAKPRDDMWASKDDVLAAIDNSKSVTINALSPRMHEGKSGFGFDRNGRIKGSVNVPSRTLINTETGGFRSSDEMTANFSAINALDAEQAITYCGAGVAATVDAFTLEMLGHPDVAVYDASLEEWANDKSLPMEGEE